MKNHILNYCLILLLILPFSSSAHEPNQSYIFLSVYDTGSIKGIIEINIEDLNQALDLTIKDEEDVTMEEVVPYLNQLRAYALEKTAFSSQLGNHPINIDSTTVFEGARMSILFHFTLDNMPEIPDELTVKFDPVYEVNDTHRGFLVIMYNWKAGIFDNESIISLFFKPDEREQVLSLTDASVMKGFLEMVKQGIWHIWIGIDHILFLLALVLPSVVLRKNREQKITPTNQSGFAKLISSFDNFASQWIPHERFRPAFIFIVKIVTLFTVAHSITLALAALGVVELPSRLVESIIAISIALAAWHNIYPLFNKGEWYIVFGFGLFHGFGFASVLGNIGLKGEFLALSLLGFNIGVEIGQIAIILLVFPILFLIRKSKYYSWFLILGSILLIFISLYWGIERGFDVDLTFGAYLKKMLQVIGIG